MKTQTGSGFSRERGSPQRRSANHAAAREVPPIVHEVLRSPGQPLDVATRAFMEPRFGHDFGAVRVHTDARASASADAVDARAYTVGQHIVFGGGAYAPGMPRGQQLLAHELTHTLQQPRELARTAAGNLKVAQANDPAEREAHAVSSAVLANSFSGGSVSTRSTSLQRETPAVNPEVASQKANAYVDMFSEVHYDLNYRSVGGNLSKWLKVLYPDGTEIEINIDDIKDTTVTPERGLEMMAQAHLGDGGRIFPLEMNPRTTGRLHAAKKSAIEAMEEYNYQFILGTVPLVMFIITMPIGMMTPRPVRTSVPRTRPRAVVPVFNPAKIADDIFAAVKHIPNPGLKMHEAATLLARMSELGAAQKVQVILEFFKRINFAIKGGVVTETSEYFIMYAENGRYAFRIMKANGAIFYGKFDEALGKFGDYFWRLL